MTSEAVALEIPEKRELSDRAEVRFRIMRALKQGSQMSQRDLARDLGGSLGGVNSCLKALINKSSIKVENFRASDNKIRNAYVLTPKDLAKKGHLTARFLKRKNARV